MILLANIADAKALLENIRTSKQSLETRLVFDLTDSVNYKIFTLNRPNRLVIDLYNTEISPSLKSSYGSKGLIKQIRLARNSRNKSRIVIETTEIVFYKVEKIPKGSNKNFRVVVDLKKGYEGSRKLLASSVNRNEFIVAIDPGHGGKDPGARGSKVIEKDLVLKISKRLKKLIDSEKNMKAFLTRTDDSFPCPGGKKNCAQLESLNERISRAKKGKADLLISIHADAFTDSSIRGATLYALPDSRKVSKGSGYKIMYRPKTKTNIKLKSGVSKRSISNLKTHQVDTHDQSIEIGSHILNAMKKDVRLRKLSPREAAFAVLKSTEIASVLIETSYLSNKNDEAFLVNPKNQDKIAKAIVKGIKSYSSDAKQQLSK